MSVLLPSWDGRLHLETCLEALDRQRDPGLPWDVWVFDNGSRDGTAEWLSHAHPRVQVVRSSANLGFAVANNRLAEATDSDVLALLNNDTRPEECWLGELVEALRSAPPDVAAVAGLIVDWDARRLDFGRGLMTFDGHAFQLDFRRPLASAALPASGDELPFACGGNMLVRRAAFRAAGGFDPRFFAYLEDVDLGWRLWSGGERVLAAPRAIVRHRSSATSGRLGLFNRGFLFERNAYLTAYTNYEDGLWEQMMPAIMLTLLSRTQTMLVANNPGSGALTLDPFASPDAALSPPLPRVEEPSPARRWMRRLSGRARPLAEAAPRLTDERTIAQFRTLHWLLGNLDAAAEARAAVQRRRRRPDREYFERFPPCVVPTYPGDERLFASRAFRQWLPAAPRCEFRALSEIMEL